MWSPQIPGVGGGEGCILVCCFLAWNQASSVYILHPFAFGMLSWWTEKPPLRLALQRAVSASGFHHL